MISLRSIARGMVTHIWLPFPNARTGYPLIAQPKALFLRSVEHWAYGKPIKITTPFTPFIEVMLTTRTTGLVFPAAGVTNHELMLGIVKRHNLPDPPDWEQFTHTMGKLRIDYNDVLKHVPVFQVGWGSAVFHSAYATWEMRMVAMTYLATASREEFESRYGHRFNFLTGQWMSQAAAQAVPLRDRHVFNYKRRGMVVSGSTKPTLYKVEV